MMNGVSYEVVNVVMTARLHAPLSLEHIYNVLLNRSDYLKQIHHFKRVCWRGAKSSNSVVMFFRSGNIILVGAKTVKQAFLEVKKAIEILKKNGITIPDEWDCEVSNIVIKTTVQLNQSFEDLAMKLEKCIYEPEQFPALIYINEEPKFTALIFSNGMTIIAGLKSEKEIPTAINCLNLKLNNGVEKNK